jgi:hypothetical protein
MGDKAFRDPRRGCIRSLRGRENASRMRSTVLLDFVDIHALNPVVVLLEESNVTNCNSCHADNY